MLTSVANNQYIHSVEKIIQYRLDQLEEPAPFILKAAAVAVSNGRSFSQESIGYMIENVNVATKSHQIFDETADHNISHLSDSSFSLVRQTLPVLVEQNTFLRNATLVNTNEEEKESSTTDETIPSLLPPPPPLHQENQNQIEGHHHNHVLNHGLPPPRLVNAYLPRHHNTFQETGPDDFARGYPGYPSLSLHIPVIDADDRFLDEEGNSKNRIGGSASSSAIDISPNQSGINLLQSSSDSNVYEFITPLEQNAIYGMIANDLREPLHYAVALFYREAAGGLSSSASGMPTPKKGPQNHNWSCVLWFSRFS
jgi:hypothetical protein